MATAAALRRRLLEKAARQTPLVKKREREAEARRIGQAPDEAASSAANTPAQPSADEVIEAARQRFVARYYNDCEAFCAECIKWRKSTDGPTPYQKDIQRRLVAKRRVCVRGPHGLGKTGNASWVILWFALTREAARVDWKAPTTASAWRQLQKFLWPEVKKWARRLDWVRIGWRGPFDEKFELQTLSLKLKFGESFAVASDTPELIEGAHADSLLYLFDEAKRIPAATFDAAEGAFSGAGQAADEEGSEGGDTAQEAFALAISTPGEPAGRFYDIQKRRPGYEDWDVRAVTLEETIAAGRVSRQWAQQRALQWGEQSAVFLNRVRGEFASSDEDGVIPLSWVELAVERRKAFLDLIAAGEASLGRMTALGVDVGTTGDKTVFAPRHDLFIADLRYLPKPDPRVATMEVAGKVKGVLVANSGCRGVIDAGGIGAGVAHRLREQMDEEGNELYALRHTGTKIEAFNASEKAENAGKPLTDISGEVHFANKRAAAWWLMRDILNPAHGHEVMLPDDDILIGDLTAPTYKTQSGGRILVESKADIRERIGRSTDAADAVIQAFFPEEVDPPAPMKTVPLNPLTTMRGFSRNGGSSSAAVPKDTTSPAAGPRRPPMPFR